LSAANIMFLFFNPKASFSRFFAFCAATAIPHLWASDKVTNALVF